METIHHEVIVTSCLFVVFLALIPYAPVQYKLSPREIVVERLAPNIVIRMEDVCAVERIDRDDLLVATFWAFGFMSTGWFGYFGRLDCRQLGSLRICASDLDDLLIIETKSEKIVISPDRPDKFVQLVRDYQQEQ